MPKIVHRIDGAITQDKKVLKYLSLKCYRRVDESKNNVTKWTFDFLKTCYPKLVFIVFFLDWL